MYCSFVRFQKQLQNVGTLFGNLDIEFFYERSNRVEIKGSME